MRRLLVLAALLLVTMVFLPGSAEAQRRGVRVHAGGFHRTAVVRTGRVGYRPGFAGRRVGYYGRGYRGGGYYGRRYGYYGGRSYGYRPAYYGAGVAAGLLTTGAIAAAAGSPYYGYGYGNPNYYGYGAGDACLRQQRVWTGYAYQSQWVRVC